MNVDNRLAIERRLREITDQIATLKSDLFDVVDMLDDRVVCERRLREITEQITALEGELGEVLALLNAELPDA